MKKLLLFLILPLPPLLAQKQKWKQILNHQWNEKNCKKINLNALDNKVLISSLLDKKLYIDVKYQSIHPFGTEGYYLSIWNPSRIDIRFHLANNPFQEYLVSFINQFQENQNIRIFGKISYDKTSQAYTFFIYKAIPYKEDVPLFQEKLQELKKNPSTSLLLIRSIAKDCYERGKIYLKLYKKNPRNKKLQKTTQQLLYLHFQFLKILFQQKIIQISQHHQSYSNYLDIAQKLIELQLTIKRNIKENLLPKHPKTFQLQKWITKKILRLLTNAFEIIQQKKSSPLPFQQKKQLVQNEQEILKLLEELQYLPYIEKGKMYWYSLEQFQQKKGKILFSPHPKIPKFWYSYPRILLAKKAHQLVQKRSYIKSIFLFTTAKEQNAFFQEAKKTLKIKKRYGKKIVIYLWGYPHDIYRYQNPFGPYSNATYDLWVYPQKKTYLLFEQFPKEIDARIIEIIPFSHQK
ncbi:MAG: hypothetical protein D6805_09590 [Planctomycetota bacterium]|nr:MAG: hypothetical protein D6805_09590 [Planctomycetota bacterium]